MVFPINIYSVKSCSCGRFDCQRFLLLAVRMFSIFFMPGLLQGQVFIKGYVVLLSSPGVLKGNLSGNSRENNAALRGREIELLAGTIRLRCERSKVVWIIQTIPRTPALGKASVRRDPSASESAHRRLSWTQTSREKPWTVEAVSSHIIFQADVRNPMSYFFLFCPADSNWPPPEILGVSVTEHLLCVQSACKHGFWKTPTSTHSAGFTTEM